MPPFQESSGRDILDVLPVGSAVTLGAGVAGILGKAFVLGAFSFALADILASELGPAYSRNAVLLPSFTRVPHGVPGAVSSAGVAFGAFGSLLSALAAAPLLGVGVASVVFLAGQLGSFTDGALMRVAGKSRRRNDAVNLIGVGTAVAIVAILVR